MIAYIRKIDTKFWVPHFNANAGQKMAQVIGLH